jgi:hypothetical protein
MGFSELYNVLKNDIPSVKAKFERINSGGCGAFALFLSDELNKRNIKHKIVWVGDSFRDEKKKIAKQIHSIFGANKKPSLSDFNHNGIYLTHVMIVIDGKFVDATGLYDSFDETEWSYRSVLTELSNEQLRVLVENPNGWNALFDRELIPKVKNMVVDIMNGVYEVKKKSFLHRLFAYMK